ncbi:MAG: hypothetical protein ACJA04_000355 [Cellvibrionaceae bacterium]|jgi:hypothetical protein
MFINKLVNKTLGFSVSCLTVLGLSGCSKKLDHKEISQLYAEKLEPENGTLKVYHLGHSLVGQNMPYMLEQLADNRQGKGHKYHSQLGWGATLKSHWDPEVPINGFESENNHNYYRDAFKAIESQEYDAFVLTEMVEIKDAIKYFDADNNLTNFARKISTESPKSRIYFYESWHQVTDPEGWINRLDNDLEKYWERQILHKALANLDGEVTIYLIPVGQVFSAFFKEIERTGGVEGIRRPEDIFDRKEDGTLDVIHINDLGAYFVALVHYAVLYRKDPSGLSYRLKRVDGSEATTPSAEAAELMQRITWEVVSRMEKTGI